MDESIFTSSTSMIAILSPNKCRIVQYIYIDLNIFVFLIFKIKRSLEIFIKVYS